MKTGKTPCLEPIPWNRGNALYTISFLVKSVIRIKLHGLAKKCPLGIITALDGPVDPDVKKID